jgi:hypothetical protein
MMDSTLGIAQLCEHIIVAVDLVDDLLLFRAGRHVCQLDISQSQHKKDVKVLWNVQTFLDPRRK